MVQGEFEVTFNEAAILLLMRDVTNGRNGGLYRHELDGLWYVLQAAYGQSGGFKIKKDGIFPEYVMNVPLASMWWGASSTNATDSRIPSHEGVNEAIRVANNAKSMQEELSLAANIINRWYGPYQLRVIALVLYTIVNLGSTSHTETVVMIREIDPVMDPGIICDAYDHLVKIGIAVAPEEP